MLISRDGCFALKHGINEWVLQLGDARAASRGRVATVSKCS